MVKVRTIFITMSVYVLIPDFSSDGGSPNLVQCFMLTEMRG